MARPRASRELTPAEIQVLRLAADGLTMQEASAKMGVGYYSVFNLNRQARAKLGAQTTVQAVAIAIRSGLLQ